MPIGTKFLKKRSFRFSCDGSIGISGIADPNSQIVAYLELWSSQSPKVKKTDRENCNIQRGESKVLQNY